LITTSRKARYNLMLDTDLVAGIDRTARAIGMNRSEFIAEAVVARLSDQVGAIVKGRSGEVTSRKVSSAASKVLKSRTAAKGAKSAAASTLTQKTKKK
jgi:hypothetical protein